MRTSLASSSLLLVLSTTVAPAFADQLLPLQQDRSVSGSAYAENLDGTEVTDVDLVQAPDFGTFVEAADAVALGTAAEGNGGSYQTSTLSSSRIDAHGAAFGGGYSFGGGEGGGSGRSALEVRFELAVPTEYTLTGFIMATDSGGSSFRLASAQQTVLDVYASGPEETVVLDSTGTLPAGIYELMAEGQGSGYEAPFSFGYGFGEFDFVFTLAPLAAPFCTSVANSTGQAATLDVAGSSSLADNDLTLIVEGLPARVPGVFFYGNQQVQLPFGPGFRCVGGTLFRLTPAFDSGLTGRVERLLDFSQAPLGGGGPGTVLPGSVWNFQAWYRDPVAGGFNTSDGLELTFCP